MKRLLNIGLFSVTAFILSGCVEFKELSLYDGYEAAPVAKKPESINALVEPIIYDDGDQDMWGLEETECKDAELTYDVVYSGNEAIRISWNLFDGPCDFEGIGFGWDGWAGKDLTGIMDYAAIRFYVKAQKERQFGLPIVLTLEDYSGGMGFAYTDNKYFERTFIDTSWQKVEVPLADFDLETENLDPSNIKQLQLELQQSASVYLDDIQLVFYTPKEQEPWMVEEERPDPLATPIVIFDDAFINDNGWGLMEHECMKVQLSSDEVYEGAKSIHAKWYGGEDCNGEDVMNFGTSWNRWFPVDFRGKQNDYAIALSILNKGKISESLDMHVGFRDYGGGVASIPLTAAQSREGKTVLDAGWTRLEIPIGSFEGDLDFSKVKHVFFRMKHSGEVYLDNIRLVRMKEN